MTNNRSSYQNQLDNINKTFTLILDEYYRIYPLSKLSPENSSIFNEFTKDKANLNENNSSIFELKNEIQKQIDDFNKDMKLKNRQIREIKSANDKLENELFNLKNGNNAAVGQLDDINTKFYDNITFSLGLLAISIFFTYRTYLKYKTFE